MLCQELFWRTLWTIIITRQIGNTPLNNANLSLCEIVFLFGKMSSSVTGGIFIIHFNVTWFAVFLNWLCQSTYTLCSFVCYALSLAFSFISRLQYSLPSFDFPFFQFIFRWIFAVPDILCSFYPHHSRANGSALNFREYFILENEILY